MGSAKIDQTVGMQKLIGVFTDCTSLIVGFVVRWFMLHRLSKVSLVHK